MPSRPNDPQFDQAHADVRNRLDRLIDFAAAREDLGSQDAIVTITGELAIANPNPLQWAAMLAVAVTRLAEFEKAGR